MSQANWIEWFRDQPTEVQPSKAMRPWLPAWLLNWEAWLTFVLVAATFLSVARSVDAAHWVDGMPSITLASFLALLTGFGLAHVKLHEAYLHLFGLLIGVLMVVAFALRFMGETSLGPGLIHFWHRFGDWIGIIRSGGITSDNMPFVTIVVAIAWIAAYLSSWAIFRWRNVWLALIPGGIGLLTNISYLPGHFSADFVVFLFGGILLVMRVNMLNRVRDWQRRGIAFPTFLSLSLLNATFWIAIALLLLAWWIPLAGESKLFAGNWNRVTSPFNNASTDWSRLFSSIDAKREVPLHTFGPTLPLQGKVALSDRVIAEVDFQDQSNEGRDLVATHYDEYTSAGWKRGSRDPGDIGPKGVNLGVAQPVNTDTYKERKDVTADIIVDTPGSVLLSIGQPLSATLDGRADFIHAGSAPDIAALHPKKDLKRGDEYATTGSISMASEAQLRAAAGDYPDYVKARYLQLPDTLPQRVRDLSTQLTAGAGNAYDRASAVEDYLRGLQTTYDVPTIPPGRDAVDTFLFDTKRGYSDYQASAMVVMLRAVGIPARLATGYAVEEYDLNTHRFVIREKNAESWPEVYFPTYGWVEFSPFGGAPLISRPFSPGNSSQGNDNSSAQDNSGPSPFDGDLGPDVPLGPADSGASLNLRHGFNWLPVYIALTALAAMALSGGIVRLLWERGLSGLDYPSRTWEKTLRLARWTRIGPRPFQTPNEIAADIAHHTKLHDAPHAVARGYLQSRYGRKQIAQNERTTLERSWVLLRNRLFKRLLHLK